MKNIFFKVITGILLLGMLTGCQREEFMDLSGFINNFQCEGIPLSVEDFYAEKTDGKANTFYCFPEKDSSKIMLKLFSDEEGKIKELRIFMPKTDENGNRYELSTEYINHFLSVAEAAVSSFTQMKKEETTAILNEMCLYEKSTYLNEGELTKEKSTFYYIYLSSFLGCEITVYNTYLVRPEPTEKPESRHLFAEDLTTRRNPDTLE